MTDDVFPTNLIHFNASVSLLKRKKAEITIIKERCDF